MVLLQHLVSSLSVSSYSVHRWMEGLISCRASPTANQSFHPPVSPLSTGTLNSCLRRVKIPDVVTTQFDLLKMSMVFLETCRGLYNVIYIIIE